MKLIRRLIMGGALAVVWALSLGGGTAAAMPSPAAGIMIDDPSDGIQCPGASTITDLSTLGVLSGQTITLCSGEYTGPLSIHNVSGVKLVGKADKTLGRPRIIPTANASGALISVTDSTNVSISGLTLDGAQRGFTVVRWSATASTITGIHVVRSSVTISKNYIVHMRRPTPDTTMVGEGILADDATPSKLSVTIIGNTVFDFQATGIHIDSSSAHYVPVVTKNLVDTITTDGNARMGIYVQATVGGSVTGNTITGNYSYRSIASCCVALEASEVQKLKIATNKISGMQIGIYLPVSHLVQDLTDTTVSGNTITDTQTGILLQAFFSSSPVEMARVKVTGNKITNHYLIGLGTGVQVQMVSAPTLTGNVITGNTLLGYPAGGEILSDDTNPADVLIGKNKVGDPIPGL